MRARSPWAGVASARISRRRALALLGAVTGGGALALTGCGDDGGGSDQGDAQQGGTLRMGTALPISHGLDPQVETATGLTIIARMYGYLLHVDSRDDSLILDHALSVEQPDSTTYVIKLKPDARFHNVPPASGRVVTAADVQQSMLRYRDNPVVTDTFWHKQVFYSVEAVDDTTLRIKTKRPYPYTLVEMGGIAAGAILPKEVVEQRIDVSAGGAGSGPLALASYQREHVRLARFAQYHATPTYLDAMEWSVFLSQEAKLAAFEQGSIDMMPNANRAEADRAADIDDTEVTAAPSLAWTSLGLRVDRAPYSDPRFRQALDLAIDRTELVDAIDGGDGDTTGPVNGHLAGGYWSLAPDEVAEAHTQGRSRDDALTEARRLLAAAGAESAVMRIQVPKLPAMLDLAELVRAMIQQTGLQVELVTLDHLTWFLNLQRGDFDSTLISHLPYESPDPGLRLYHSLGLNGAGSAVGFADAEIDRAIEATWSIEERAERQVAVRNAQRTMIEARPFLQLHTGISYESARDYVRNRQPELPGTLAAHHAWQWLAT